MEVSFQAVVGQLSVRYWKPSSLYRKGAATRCCGESLVRTCC